jgi:hypothetical protein
MNNSAYFPYTASPDLKITSSFIRNRVVQKLQFLSNQRFANNRLKATKNVILRRIAELDEGWDFKQDRSSSPVPVLRRLLS